MRKILICILTCFLLGSAAACFADDKNQQGTSSIDQDSITSSETSSSSDEAESSQEDVSSDEAESSQEDVSSDEIESSTDDGWADIEFPRPQ